MFAIFPLIIFPALALFLLADHQKIVLDMIVVEYFLLLGFVLWRLIRNEKH